VVQSRAASSRARLGAGAGHVQGLGLAQAQGLEVDHRAVQELGGLDLGLQEQGRERLVHQAAGDPAELGDGHHGQVDLELLRVVAGVHGGAEGLADAGEVGGWVGQEAPARTSARIWASVVIGGAGSACMGVLPLGGLEDMARSRGKRGPSTSTSLRCEIALVSRGL
jgi:hypothetical protein